MLKDTGYKQVLALNSMKRTLIQTKMEHALTFYIHVYTQNNLFWYSFIPIACRRWKLNMKMVGQVNQTSI